MGDIDTPLQNLCIRYFTWDKTKLLLLLVFCLKKGRPNLQDPMCISFVNTHTHTYTQSECLKNKYENLYFSLTHIFPHLPSFSLSLPVSFIFSLSLSHQCIISSYKEMGNQMQNVLKEKKWVLTAPSMAYPFLLFHSTNMAKILRFKIAN